MQCLLHLLSLHSPHVIPMMSSRVALYAMVGIVGTESILFPIQQQKLPPPQPLHSLLNEKVSHSQLIEGLKLGAPPGPLEGEVVKLTGDEMLGPPVGLQVGGIHEPREQKLAARKEIFAMKYILKNNEFT